MKLFLIIVSIVFFILVCWGTTATIIAKSNYDQLLLLKHEKNLVQQNMEKYKQEMELQEVILLQQRELLEKAKKAKTLKECLAVWKELP